MLSAVALARLLTQDKTNENDLFVSPIRRLIDWCVGNKDAVCSLHNLLKLNTNYTRAGRVCVPVCALLALFSLRLNSHFGDFCCTEPHYAHSHAAGQFCGKTLLGLYFKNLTRENNYSSTKCSSADSWDVSSSPLEFDREAIMNGASDRAGRRGWASERGEALTTQR